MIIVRLTGGLGNQMFQYAFGRALAERHETELKLDLNFYSDPKWNNVPFRTYDLDIFNIREILATEDEIASLARRVRHDLADRVLNRLLGTKRSHIREPHFHFSQTTFDAPDNVYLSGYWQSEKYFAGVRDLLRGEFSFREDPSARAVEILREIKSTNSICVHVRRGDFVTNPLSGHYGVEYYKKGEEIILSKVNDPTFFVFSDDIDWCKANLNFKGPTSFVSDDFGSRKFRDDLRLMSACKHLIVANSSFSWWAAWLNENPETVIAPNKWVTDVSFDTSDLIPSGWIRI
jgi:hypothetical protein